MTTYTRRNWRHTLGHFLILAGVTTLTINCFPGADGALDFNAFEMRSFDDCNALESHLKERASQKASAQSVAAISGSVWRPAGFEQNTPGDTSATNNQERGVDEADVFKVDDRFAYALHGGNLVIAQAEGQGSGERFQVSDGHLVSETPIEGEAFEMHLSGDRVMIIARTQRREIEERFQARPISRSADKPVFKAVLYDVSDRSKPTLLREVILEGEHLSSRRINSKIYIVSKALLGGPEPEATPSGGERWLTARRNNIRSASLDAWLPSVYDIKYDGTEAKTDVQRCSCKSTFQSPSATGDDLIAIYTLDIQDGNKSITTSAVIGEGGHVYASTDTLVVAFPGEDARRARRIETDEDEFDDSFNESPDSEQVTHLHQFEINNGKIAYEGSGQVDGWILNQFSLSEYNNVLRVATMTGERGQSNARSHVFTLKSERKSFESYSTKNTIKNYLSILGEVRDIAPDEDLYAAHFQGEIGYLITFRETDPLWTIDLSDPKNPEVLGELMVPGYSTYIHPISNNRLLAVGRGGWVEDEGIKLSLFDVSRLSAPTDLHEHVVGDQNTMSEALTEHRAFNYMPDYKTLALPIKQTTNDSLQLYRVENSRFIFQGTVNHRNMAEAGNWTVRRSLLSGKYLWALSEAGISITNMDNQNTVAEIDLRDGKVQ